MRLGLSRSGVGVLSGRALAGLAGVLALAGAAGPATAQVLDQPVPQPVQRGVAGKPAIKLDTTNLDLGRLFDDKVETRQVRFENTGTAPLEILSLRASCGCTVPELAKTTYMPGEVGEITVSFNPHRRKGQQRTRVTIRTNDPDRPTLTVNVAAFVQQQLLMEPAILNFERVGKGESKSLEFSVTGRGDDFDLPEFELSEGTHFTVEKIGREPGEIEGETGTRVRLRVTLKDTVPVGSMADRLTFQTSIEGMGRKSVGVNAQVLGDIVTTPPRVMLRGVQRGQPFTSQVRISHRDRETFKILSVEATIADGDAPSAVVQNVSTGYRIVVNGVAPETGPRFLRGEIVVKTDIPGEEEIRIPFFGNAR